MPAYNLIAHVPVHHMCRPNFRQSMFSFPLLVLWIAVAAAALAAGCRSPSSAPTASVSTDTWATVNGREITRDAVDKAYRRVREGSQPLSDEEMLTAKLAILNDLIVQEILLANAQALKIEVSDTELDSEYAQARKDIPEEAFQQELTRRGLTAADMREDRKSTRLNSS